MFVQCAKEKVSLSFLNADTKIINKIKGMKKGAKKDTMHGNKHKGHIIRIPMGSAKPVRIIQSNYKEKSIEGIEK